MGSYQARSHALAGERLLSTSLPSLGKGRPWGGLAVLNQVDNPHANKLTIHIPHRARARMGLRCLTVRVNNRTVRHLISTGYLSLESRELAPMVAIALEAWIYDNIT